MPDVEDQVGGYVGKEVFDVFADKRPSPDVNASICCLPSGRLSVLDSTLKIPRIMNAAKDQALNTTVNTLERVTSV